MSPVQQHESSLAQARKRNSHLNEYIKGLQSRGIDEPVLKNRVDRDLKDQDEINIIYPIGDPIFVHVYGTEGSGYKYNGVEPELDTESRELLEEIQDYIFEKAAYEDVKDDPEKLKDLIEESVDEFVEKETNGLLFSRDIPKERVRRVRYRLMRDLADLGPLEPLMRDPYIEDIYVVGLEPIKLIHKIFDEMTTNLQFENMEKLDEYLVNLGDRVNVDVNASDAVFDTAMPDGSRLNIIYPEDISIKGPSFTIRKFEETPLTMPQIIKWNTFSPRMGAYMWLAMEQGMSCIVSGETASGKTTTLNSMLPFIPHDNKVYSVEDTAEVQPPQETWQQMIIKESEDEQISVEYFDLIKAAMRSRPEALLVGEIRGEEGNIAFQAMQTGVPVMSTFHAASVHKLIQRMSGDPINVPLHFFPNLDFVVIQQAVYVGGEFLRRMLALTEITGYLREEDSVEVREIFGWDPVSDSFDFRGKFNSQVLEEKIAPRMGFDEKRDIYLELEKRAQIIKNMIREDILGYDEVIEVLRKWHRGGMESLPPRLRVKDSQVSIK